MSKRRYILVVCITGLALLLLTGAAKFLRYTEDDLDALLDDPRYKNDRTEKLIVMLDGVPYETINDLRQRGYFSIFKNPSRVIVPFPSMTNVSAADIWHAEQPEGYESLYFDKGESMLVGGSKTYLHRRAPRPGDYHSLLDYVEPKAYEFAVYGFPRRINRADMRRFFLAYVSSNKRVFRAFLKSTDGLAHRGGREALERSLIELDRLLSSIYRDSGGRLEIVLFSDHGNSYNRSKRVDLEGHLRSYGFKVDDRMGSEKSVVIPDFGLANYAAIYAAPSNKRRIAEAVRQLEEVDVVAFEENGCIQVLGRNGRAKIYYDERTRSYRYDMFGQDPLEIAEVLEQLKSQGKVSGGFAFDRVWFDALKEHRYPDAIFRLHEAMTGLVKNKADVLVSFREGYVWGSKAFEWFDRFMPISAFHGGLMASQSQAFFMSTAKQAPPCMRGRDIMSYWTDEHGEGTSRLWEGR